MTPTQNNNFPETRNISIQGDLVNSDNVKIVDSLQEEVNTNPKPLPSGRTVPSTKTSGNVLLRYSI